MNGGRFLNYTVYTLRERKRERYSNWQIFNLNFIDKIADSWDLNISNVHGYTNGIMSLLAKKKGKNEVIKSKNIYV